MKYFTKDEIQELLRVAKKHSERDWLLLAVAYLYGFRATEAVSLHSDQVRDGKIVVQREKNSRETTQPLLSHSNELLNVKRHLEDKKGWIFPSRKGSGHISRGQFWRIVQRYADLADVDLRVAHPHALKRSIAVHSHTAGIRNVSNHLGHKSLSSTYIYLRGFEDEAASRAVFAAVV